MRARLKAMIETSATRSGVTRLLARRRRGGRLVLAYHNIVPAGESPWGERSLHLPLESFRRHLDTLARHCEVVPLRELLEGGEGESDRPKAAITFDDAYRGAAASAPPELEARGFPATYFVNPGLRDEPGFWWDRLAEGFGGDLPTPLRTRCLRELGGRQGDVLAWAESEGMSIGDPPEHARPGDQGVLDRLAGRRGISLECHTWSHPNLTALSAPERTLEFERADGWMKERWPSSATILSYPYGLHDAEVRRQAGDHGYRAGLAIEGGWLRREGGDDFAVPRLNVPSGLSAGGLGLRLAGLGVGR